MITAILLTVYFYFKYPDFPKVFLLVAIVEFIAWLYYRHKEYALKKMYLRYDREITELYYKTFTREQ